MWRHDSSVFLWVLILVLAGCPQADPSDDENTGDDDTGDDDTGDDDDDTGDDDTEVPWGTLEVIVAATTSSTVELSWDAPADATEIRVYLGPEPPPADGDDLPLEVLQQTLAGDAGGITIGALAAATDAFFRVVAAGGAEGDAVGYAHARLVGGPRATLDTDLREVHAVGPDTLMLVLDNSDASWDGDALQDNTGEDWQGGTWTVMRHDGSALVVDAVHRHSIAVGQPDHELGFENWNDDQSPDVDHRIFVLLGDDVGQRELLTVQHSGAAGSELEVIVPFSDHYLETPLIQVNQVGYNPRAARRYAYVYGWMGDGGAADLSGLPASAEVLIEPLHPLEARSAAATGLAITQRSESDEDAAGEVRQIDLSTVPAAEGVRYRVRVPGVGISWPTAVSEEAAHKAFYAVWRGLFHNRWCGDLDADSTEWSRPPDHCEAYFVEEGVTFDMFDESTPLENLAPVVGGHHDAGDFDIRPYHVVVAQYLMRAYEMDPTRYADGQLTIPESNNGIPDVLDEALWSVAGWAQLQNPDGSVRSGVESWRHPAGYYYAHEDQLAYWTHDPMAWHTAYVAGLMAQAAYLVLPYDAALAGDLEDGARAAYGWATDQGAPDEYLLYGASELFRLTGEALYGDDYVDLWWSIDDWGRGAYDNIQTMLRIYTGAFTSYTPAMADFTMAYYDAPGADTDVRTITLEQLDERADESAALLVDSTSAHRHGRDGLASDWGVGVTTGRHVDMIYQRLQLGGLDATTEQDYLDALSLAADYALGCNPASYSYITGLGSRHPEEPLHLDSLAFILDQQMPPVPGIPVFGPVTSFPGAYYYDPIGAAFYPDFDAQPLGLRLSDTRASVAMSEFTVWETQAAMAELFGALLGPNNLTPPASWLPGGEDHRNPLPSHMAE